MKTLYNKTRNLLVNIEDYKYISEFEAAQYDDIPYVVLNLFNEITKGNFSKKDLYTYCDTYFIENDELQEIIGLIKQYRNRINLEKLKHFILKEIR